MAMPKEEGLCKVEMAESRAYHEGIPDVVRELAASCDGRTCYEHVNPIPLPELNKVVEIIHTARRVLFPGYFQPHRLDRVNLEYSLGQEVTRLYELAASQITWAVRHDCVRYELECTHCEERGGRTAMEFLARLIELRRLLAGDVRAALAGDPAAKGPDEIIFSYPGFFAITVYRLAHLLLHLGVPLLPRMMTEYAHSKTGIDIHPGAEIGDDFFIDHGTGVVVGETAVIGNNVRIYQGVTLGALSLPKEAMESLRSAKRHPTIEDEVVVYAGATILGGGTVVGARSVVGGNVWLTESVPPDTRVMMKSPELIYRGPGGRKKEGPGS